MGQPSEGIPQNGFPFQPRIGWQKQSAVCLAKHFSVRGRVVKIARTGTSHALVATRTNGKCSTGFVSHRPSLQVRIATLPHSPLSPPSLASPCVSDVAGVAVLSTPLATTVERARQQGFWARRGWTHQMAEAGRGVPREAFFCQRTCGQYCSNRNEPCSCRSKCSTGFVTHRPSLQVRIATLPHSPLAPTSLASLPVSPCVSTVAGVAVLSTPLATIVQRARQQGFWARRGLAWESVAARVCCEAGARVWTTVFVRDMDLASFHNLDGRRLEVVADGLPVHGGAQMDIDTTMLSPLNSNGVARRGASVKKGLALEAARERKEMTYPELAGEGGRARLAAFRSCTVPVLLGLGPDSRPPRGVALWT